VVSCRCDGSEPQRKYYDKLARLMPLNTMVRGATCSTAEVWFYSQWFVNANDKDGVE